MPLFPHSYFPTYPFSPFKTKGRWASGISTPVFSDGVHTQNGFTCHNRVFLGQPDPTVLFFHTNHVEPGPHPMTPTELAIAGDIIAYIETNRPIACLVVSYYSHTTNRQELQIRQKEKPV